MRYFKEIKILFTRELSREFSNKSSIFSILLYILSISYLLYFLMNVQGALVQMEVKYWNILFWLIILFSSVNTIVLNFAKETRGIYLYYYTILSPEGFIISKIIYHILVSSILTLLTFIIFIIWFGNPIENSNLFIGVILLGSISFSILYTLMAAISFHTQNSTIIASILGFPMTIPIITYISKLCRESFSMTPSDNLWPNICILLGFNIIMILLSVILYPYIWRE